MLHTIIFNNMIKTSSKIPFVFQCILSFFYLCPQTISRMIYSNYHTHSLYSDGKADMKAYCDKAIELGFHSLGFSDHAPVLFENSYSIPPKKLNDYFENISSLKKEYEGRLKVYCSLEADYIPGKTHDFDFFRGQAPIDYIIGSIHLIQNPKTQRRWFIDGGDQDIWDMGLDEIFDGDIRRGVVAFYEQTMDMIDSQKPEVIGHLDKIKMHNKERLFSTQNKWYQDLVDASLALIKEHHTILEINTRGLYKGRSTELFPSINIAQKAQRMGIPLLISSDAHHPEELNGAYAITLALLKENGIKELVEYDGQTWNSISI